MRVAVVGMGRMGRALAGRLIEGGHQVAVWNRTPGRAADLIDQGASEATSLAEAASGAQALVTILADDAAVRQVTLAPGGLVESLGKDSVLADASTVSPGLADELGARFPRFVAMPVLGAPGAVRAGTAGYLVGGDDQDVTALAPLLGSLSNQVRHYPRPGHALAAKLASNLMLLSSVVALSEAFAVGRAAGLSDDQLRDLLGSSPMVPDGINNRFEALLGAGIDSWWTTALGSKDAGLAAGAAAAAGVDLPLAATVRDRFAQAAADGLGDEDITAVARLYRRG